METIKKVIKRGDLSKIHIPDDFGELGYKGVVPKGSFTLGVAF